MNTLKVFGLGGALVTSAVLGAVLTPMLTRSGSSAIAAGRAIGGSMVTVLSRPGAMLERGPARAADAEDEELAATPRRPLELVRSPDEPARAEPKPTAMIVELEPLVSDVESALAAAAGARENVAPRVADAEAASTAAREAEAMGDTAIELIERSAANSTGGLGDSLNAMRELMAQVRQTRAGLESLQPAPVLNEHAQTIGSLAKEMRALRDESLGLHQKLLRLFREPEPAPGDGTTAVAAGPGGTPPGATEFEKEPEEED
ncbi:MAG: hypothetical protein AAFR38_10595 [Planctomycetota bacterium]